MEPYVYTYRDIDEPGWITASMHDPSERRGIWFRLTKNGQVVTMLNYTSTKEISSIELAGGREGEYYVKLQVGDVITARTLFELESILDVSRWMLEEYELEAIRKREHVRFLKWPDEYFQANAHMWLNRTRA